MKNFQILLLLLSLTLIQTVGICEQINRPNISQSVYWGGASPQEVAARANRSNGVSSASDGSPDAESSMFNPLGAYGTMIQMMNPNSSYNGVEMQRQQADYVKQQTSN